MGLIEVINISHSFGDKVLYKNASFELFKGEHMGIVGENGAGKSTTIRSILGMIKPDNGDVSVFGKKLTAKTKEDIGVPAENASLKTTAFFRDTFNALPGLQHLLHLLFMLRLVSRIFRDR